MKTSNFKLTLFIIIALFSQIFAVNTVYAQKDRVTTLINPIGGNESKTTGDTGISSIIGTAINSVMGVVGAITLLVFVYGGFMWLTSAGNEEKVKTGSNAMLYAAIGLFIIFGSYAILKLIINNLTGSS